MDKKILFFFILASILLLEFFLGFHVFWGEKILPNIKIDNILLSGLTKNQAEEKLEAAVKAVKTDVIKVTIEDKVFQIPVKELGAEFDIENAVENAYALGHSTNLWKVLTQTLSQFTTPKVLRVGFLLNEAKLDEYLANAGQEFELPTVESKLEIKQGKVIFTPGKTGRQVDRQTLKTQILNNFSNLKIEPLKAPLLVKEPEIGENLAETAILAAEKYVGKKLELQTANETFEILDNQILTLVSPDSTSENFALKPNREKIAAYIQNDLNPKISREPVDAKFQFEAGKVVAFTPSIDGIKLETEKAADLIYQALTNLETNQKINLPVVVSPAKIKTADVNNLGISELVGRGVSNFAGSTPERIHNIKLASSRINGTLVAPGEIFSFNQTVGEISTATGYTSAYIISKGRTILGEGGGVCQVSTTVFRAAVNSGLEIVDRRAHAYRVRYYEQGGHQVGLDATIFIPSVDFKFRNDTTNHILIQAYIKANELYFDFYGTSDGRIVEVSKPVVSNVRPAPEPLYEQDPTLPAGVTKQVDFAATGASVTVSRVVKRNGQILHSDVFRSNYKPWQAVYKVGTGT